MSMIDINDIPETKSEMMNRDHKEFVDILNMLIVMAHNSAGNNETKIYAGFERLLEHARQHFLKEEELMLTSNFPPYAIHKREHDRILKILKDSTIHWQLNRDRKIIKSLIEDILPNWLIQHVSTMDSVTGHFLENIDSQKITES